MYQPHRYSRISSLLEDFKSSFGDADEILIMPIYSAGEKNTYGISSEILAQKIDGGKNIKVVSGGEEIENIVLNQKQADALYICMGAGDIYRTAYKIKEELEKA